ncbi:MAG: DUF411 domain-containing protein [Burkholderiales bacterium]
MTTGDAAVSIFHQPSDTTRAGSLHRRESVMRPLIWTALALLTLAPMALGSSAAEEREAVVYKNPDCGCCAGYVDHLKASGFQVQVVDTEDLTQIKRQYSVPETLEGCHTTILGGYVIEGHVPVNIIERLLAERPQIRGISLPGMPMGSPGMGGSKDGPFEVLELSDGDPNVYAVE